MKNGMTPANIYSFKLKEITNGEGQPGICIHTEFSVIDRGESSDKRYYLMRVDSCSGRILDGKPIYSISREEGKQNGDTFEFAMDIPVPKAFEEEEESNIARNGNGAFVINEYTEAVMSKYAWAEKKDSGEYELISEGVYLSNPECVGRVHTEYYQPASKKGIQDAGFYRGDMGTKHTLQNIFVGNILRSGPGEGRTEYRYKGKSYYFDDNRISGLRGIIKEYNKEGISVTLAVLLNYPESRLELVHPAARKKGAAPYYMMNTTTQESQEMWEAMFSYIGYVFGQDNCFVSNWVLGNEVNSHEAWNYKGDISFEEYVKGYASSFRMLYYGVKLTRPSSRVFISLDNIWAEEKAIPGYSGKKVLDGFANYIHMENQGIQWNVAFHPYSHPLPRVDFWNDYSDTTDSVESPYISMRNLNYLNRYLENVEKKYGKDEGSIRVILSEQGWTASQGEKFQAEALARAYYLAEFNERVDAFIIRAEMDDEEEVRGGLALGMQYKGDDGSERKRVSYYTYKYMDTPKVSNPNEGSSRKALKDYVAENLDFSLEAHRNNFKAAQSLLIQTDWEKLIPGYDETELNKMPYGKAE